MREYGWKSAVPGLFRIAPTVDVTPAPEVMVICPAEACFKNGERDGSEGITNGWFEGELLARGNMEEPNCPGEGKRPSPERWSDASVDPNARLGVETAGWALGVVIEEDGEDMETQVLVGVEGEVWKQAKMMWP